MKDQKKEAKGQATNPVGAGGGAGGGPNLAALAALRGASGGALGGAGGGTNLAALAALRGAAGGAGGGAGGGPNLAALAALRGSSWRCSRWWTKPCSVSSFERCCRWSRTWKPVVGQTLQPWQL